MLAVGAAGRAVVGAVVAVGMFLVGVAVLVQMLVVMGMLMGVGMGMIMGMGMGHAVVGVFVGMGVIMLVAVVTGADMVVMQMHTKHSFLDFFFIIPGAEAVVKTFIFSGISPHGACNPGGNRV
jgi:hypothetical protein